MYGAVRGFLSSLEPTTGFTQLLGALVSACALGFIVYLIGVLALWLLAGRPQGTETALIDRIKPRLERLAAQGRRPN
jgi:hypothetical protein